MAAIVFALLSRERFSWKDAGQIRDDSVGAYHRLRPGLILCGAYVLNFIFGALLGVPQAWRNSYPGCRCRPESWRSSFYLALGTFMESFS